MTLKDLEAALQSGNDEEVAFNSFKSMVLIMHESGHWARFMQAGLPNRTAGPYEDGAIVEEFTFGVRFSYTNHLQWGDNANAIRDDLIRGVANGTRFTLKFLTGKTITNLLRKTKAVEGQTGDPVLKAAKIREGKVFKPSNTYDTGAGGGKKSNDTTY